MAGEWLLQLPLEDISFGQLIVRAVYRGKSGAQAGACSWSWDGKDPLYVMDDVEDIDRRPAAGWKEWY